MPASVSSPVKGWRLKVVSERLSKPVVTQIEDAPPFWEAEDYHQQYLEKRGQASCSVTLGAA